MRKCIKCLMHGATHLYGNTLIVKIVEEFNDL